MSGESAAEDVDPLMNQSSSCRMEGRWTRLVVSSGSVLLRSEKRSCGGAKMEIVPVPVRSERGEPVVRICRMRERYWCSSWSCAAASAVVVETEDEGAVLVEAEVVLNGVVEVDAVMDGAVEVLMLDVAEGDSVTIVSMAEGARARVL